MAQWCRNTWAGTTWPECGLIMHDPHPDDPAAGPGPGHNGPHQSRDFTWDDWTVRRKTPDEQAAWDKANHDGPD